MITWSKKYTLLIGTGYSSLVVLAMIGTFVSDNYIPIAVLTGVIIFFGLFFIGQTSLFFLIIASRILLDSIPGITYNNIISDLSVMEFFTFGLMLFMTVYILIKNSMEFDEIVKYMAILLFGMCLTTIYQGNYGDFVFVGSRWLYFLISYIFFKYLLKNISLKNVLLVIALASIYPFLNQLYSIFTGSGSTHLGIYTRFSGTYHHVVKVANYLTFAVPAALYLFEIENRYRYKLFYMALIGIYHIGIYFAGFRTNWIAIAAFWFIYILCVSKKKIIASGILGIIIILLWPFIGEIILDKLNPLIIIFNDPAPLFNTENYQYNDLLSCRIRIWTLNLSQFFNTGFIDQLFGLGLRYSERLLTVYMHNEYIGALVETGIVGLFLFLLWIFISLKTVYKQIQYNHNYALIVLAIFISFLLIACATMPFRHIEVMNYMAFYLASACKAKREYSNSKQQISVKKE